MLEKNYSVRKRIFYLKESSLEKNLDEFGNLSLNRHLSQP
jgi:hypothetical protein